MASPDAVITPRQERTRGDAFRDQVLSEYEISGIGAETLVAQIARTLEELELLEADVRDRGVAIPGARGILVGNPSLAGITRHRGLLARLLREAFPAESETVSEQATRAARTRWAARRAVT